MKMKKLLADHLKKLKGSPLRNIKGNILIRDFVKFNADPEYDPEQEQEYLQNLKNELMPKLEAQHAQYLDPDWQPNENWWVSLLYTHYDEKDNPFNDQNKVDETIKKIKNRDNSMT